MGLAASYAGRLGLTAWRRKSTVLGVAAGLVLLIYCLQYNAASHPDVAAAAAASSDKGMPAKVEELSAPLQRSLHEDNLLNNEVRLAPQGNGLADRRLKNGKGNVQFVLANGNANEDASGLDDSEAIAPKDADFVSSRPVNAYVPDPPAAHLHAHAQQPHVLDASTSEPASFYNYDQQGLYQMGIPYVNLDPKKPYIPEHRLVHLDLKGAPPKVSFLKRLFPFVRQLGATGVLLEWEDMFPFSGPLASIVAGNHYSREEVKEIVEAAKNSDLEVIPLVQTFGHVEFALKHAELTSLREVPESPQALCPSLNASMDFVERMIEQVMELHQDARFLHIGCDEVFQMGECPRCRTQMRETLFLSHVARVARFVRARYSVDGAPVMPIIWDDMLRHLSTQSLEEFRIGELVEPMVWVYAEDVYRFVPAMVWEKYAAVFPRIWSASAFKGAFGETLYIPNVKRHLENNLRWLEVMTTEGPRFKGGFRGIAITGWQRYDHFAVLCELLPAAVPSLAVTLLATSNGYFNQSLKTTLYSSLGCPRNVATHYHSDDAIVSLNNDPHLWDKFGRCFFPGAPFFKLTSRLHAAEQEVKEFLTSVTRSKGWMTDFNVRHNFSSPLRVDELMADHPRIYHTLASLVRTAKDAMEDVFDSFTIAEWIEQRIYPDLKILDQLQQDSIALKAVRVWPSRPFPPLRELQKLGLQLSDEDTDTNGTPPMQRK